MSRLKRVQPKRVHKLHNSLTRGLDEKELENLESTFVRAKPYLRTVKARLDRDLEVHMNELPALIGNPYETAAKVAVIDSLKYLDKLLGEAE